MLITIGNFFFKWRDKIFPLMMLPLLLVPPAQGNVFGIDAYILDIVGIIAMIAGEALRIGVVGLKYIKRGGLDKKVYAEDLVTGGLFSVCRNPLYVGNILIAIGALMIHAQPVVLLAGSAIILFIYKAIVTTEEHFLRNKFGNGYDEYCQDVNRWLPNLAKLNSATEGITFNVKRVFSKEYSTVAGVMTSITVLLTLQHVYRVNEIPMLTWVMLLLIVSFLLTIRSLKKTGRLVH